MITGIAVLFDIIIHFEELLLKYGFYPCLLCSINVSFSGMLTCGCIVYRWLNCCSSLIIFIEFKVIENMCMAAICYFIF